jgi:hypothetical protein
MKICTQYSGLGSTSVHEIVWAAVPPRKSRLKIALFLSFPFTFTVYWEIGGGNVSEETNVLGSNSAYKMT